MKSWDDMTVVVHQMLNARIVAGVPRECFGPGWEIWTASACPDIVS